MAGGADARRPAGRRSSSAGACPGCRGSRRGPARARPGRRRAAAAAAARRTGTPADAWSGSRSAAPRLLVLGPVIRMQDGGPGVDGPAAPGRRAIPGGSTGSRAPRPPRAASTGRGGGPTCGRATSPCPSRTPGRARPARPGCTAPRGWTSSAPPSFSQQRDRAHPAAATTRRADLDRAPTLRVQRDDAVGLVPGGHAVVDEGEDEHAPDLAEPVEVDRSCSRRRRRCGRRRRAGRTAAASSAPKALPSAWTTPLRPSLQLVTGAEVEVDALVAAGELLEEAAAAAGARAAGRSRSG